MPEQKRELTNIEVDEVSLVDAPANQRTFFFWKSKGEGGMDDDLRKKLNEVLGVNIDDDYISEVRKAYESGDIDMYAALGTLSSYMAEMPEAMLNATRDLVKLSLVEPGMEKKSEDDIDMEKEDLKTEEIQSVVEKALAGIDESASGAKKAIRELLPENVKKDVEDDDWKKKMASDMEDLKTLIGSIASAKPKSEEEEKEEKEKEKEKEEGSETTDEPITDVMKAVELLAKAAKKNAEDVEKLRKTAAPKKSKEEGAELEKGEEEVDLWKSIPLE